MIEEVKKIVRQELSFLLEDKSTNLASITTAEQLTSFVWDEIGGKDDYTFWYEDYDVPLEDVPDIDYIVKNPKLFWDIVRNKWHRNHLIPGKAKPTGKDAAIVTIRIGGKQVKIAVLP